MGLFNNIFKRKSKIKNETTEIPFYWEDNYCQIEIVSKKNIDTIKSTIKLIDKFHENKESENGFNEIFIREKLPFPTLKEYIQVYDFEKLLSEKGFQKANQISYDGYKVIDCSPNTSNAFSLSSFNIFYDCNKEFVNNVWISTSLIVSIDQFKKISETLFELGEGYELVLIDWNSSDLVDLTKKNQLKDYLMSYWK